MNAAIGVVTGIVAGVRIAEQQIGRLPVCAAPLDELVKPPLNVKVPVDCPQLLRVDADFAVVGARLEVVLPCQVLSVPLKPSG